MRAIISISFFFVVNLLITRFVNCDLQLNIFLDEFKKGEFRIICRSCFAP